MHCSYKTCCSLQTISKSE